MEDDGLIMWKEYDNCITFIGATISLSKKLLEDLLDFAYNSMICCVSLNEIKHIKNIEHLKRELKVTFFRRTVTQTWKKFNFFFSFS